MLAGIGENAGVVGIGDGWAVTFRRVTGHPTKRRKPYQGAATGVGIVANIMAMGARPIAVMDQLRFRPTPPTRRVVGGVVRGVGGWQLLGLPTSAVDRLRRELRRQPLVSTLCAGVLRTGT